MIEKNEIIEITPKQKKQVFEYLESRLGIYGITSYDFKVETDKKTKEVYAKQEIQAKYLGITKHMIKKCILDVTMCPQVCCENGTTNGYVHLHLQYDHHSHGSNGCGMNVKLSFNTNTVYEVDEK